MGRARVRWTAPVIAVGLVTAIVAARSRQLRWGATDAELAAALPGDDRVPKADLVATRAIDVAAPPAAVWPWLAQLGQGRGGFYTYTSLENLAGCEMRNASRVVEEWQDLAVGDQVRLHPDLPLTVVDLEAGRAFVLQGVPGAVDSSPPFDFTWAFAVVPGEAEGASRVLVRERYGYLRWWTSLMVEPVSWVSFVMSERMLRGIRDRAQRCARTTPAA